MKFQSTVVAAALFVAGMSTASAFAPSMALQSRQKAQIGKSMLNMVATSDATDATSEIVNGDIKPRKTREVSVGSFSL
jgi:hypothetical protein